MVGTRHEKYENIINGLPFILNANLKRTSHHFSRDNNWHENLEIQLCTKGSGTVLLNGREYAFDQNDIIVVNSNVIHRTGTKNSLTYSCIIISTEFCRQVGFNTDALCFAPHIKSPRLVALFHELLTVHSDHSDTWRIARLNGILLKMLLELAEHHIDRSDDGTFKSKSFKTVKAAISFIRENYQRKLTLDEIAQAVLCDKYALCREFKKLTGQTVVENINSYRCIKAIDLLTAGSTVGETALLCGFENLSFFTKTFKKYTGKLPSEYKPE